MDSYARFYLDNLFGFDRYVELYLQYVCNMFFLDGEAFREDVDQDKFKEEFIRRFNVQGIRKLVEERFEEEFRYGELEKLYQPFESQEIKESITTKLGFIHWLAGTAGGTQALVLAKTIFSEMCKEP